MDSCILRLVVKTVEVFEVFKRLIIIFGLFLASFLILTRTADALMIEYVLLFLLLIKVEILIILDDSVRARGAFHESRLP